MMAMSTAGVTQEGKHIMIWYDLKVYLFFSGVLCGKEDVVAMMGGSLHEWFSMVFYGFLLRRNKDVRRNREFEIQGSDNYFFEMIKINMRHKMLLNGLLRPGGNHKYMSWAFGFWMCSILEPCEFFSQTSDSMIFSLHFVQVGTKDVEHFFRFKVYIFFSKNMGKF